MKRITRKDENMTVDMNSAASVSTAARIASSQIKRMGGSELRGDHHAAAIGHCRAATLLIQQKTPRGIQARAALDRLVVYHEKMARYHNVRGYDV